MGLMIAVVGLVVSDRDALNGVDWSLIPVAFGFVVLSTVVKAYRWSLLVRRSHLDLSFRHLLGSYLVGAFFSTVLPTSVGGDAVRAVDTAAKTGRRADSASSVLIERGIGLLTVIGAGSVFALFIERGEVPLVFLLLVHGLFISGVAGLLVLRQGWFIEPILALMERVRLGKLTSSVQKLSEAFSTHLGSPGILLAMIGLSLLANVLTMGATYLVLMAVADPIPVAEFVPMMSLATAAELIPISIAALGVKESAYVFFLSLVDVDNGVAGILAIIMRVLTWGLAMLGGVVFLYRTLRSTDDDIGPDMGDEDTQPLTRDARAFIEALYAGEQIHADIHERELTPV
jgi:uncharacterized protein (TIRG00374 family)